MSKKIITFALSAMLLALSLSAEAQQPVKVPRIGYVSSLGSPNNPGPLGEAFREGLRDLGYIEGKTIVIEYRYLEGDESLFNFSLLSKGFLAMKIASFNKRAISSSRGTRSTDGILLGSSSLSINTALLGHQLLQFFTIGSEMFLIKSRHQACHQAATTFSPGEINE